MGITINGATPVFVEPDEYFNLDAAKIEAAVTERTRAILPVHLYGQASNMGDIMCIAQKYGLKVIEDCAQSHGAAFGGRQTGVFGDIGCFSFYPTKNIGAFGDAGCIVTNDADIAEQFRVFRNYGSEKQYHNKILGCNSRLDELQAGLLRVRLGHYGTLLEERAELCDRYGRELDNPVVVLPGVREGATSVWHQYVIKVKERARMMEHLKSRGIGFLIHYPIPPHLSEAYAYLGFKEGAFPTTESYAAQVLSIPLYNGMTRDEQSRVIEAINSFK
jgi:dTDP-4-amino-4,6-dideoxygalactose transaminase